MVRARSLQSVKTASVVVSVTASSSVDTGFRDWSLWLDKSPGSYLGGGEYSTPPDVQELDLSLNTLTHTFPNLPYGSHKLYFAVTGPSYSGTVTIGGKSTSFTGVDATHPFEVDFTLGSGGVSEGGIISIFTKTVLGVPVWAILLLSLAAIGSISFVAQRKKK